MPFSCVVKALYKLDVNLTNKIEKKAEKANIQCVGMLRS